jgi:uncharacterized protein (TIGR00106 family)
MSVIADFSIFPIGRGESLSPYAARAVAVVKSSGLPHLVGPMGTSVEGEWDEVLAVIDACYKALEPDCDRVYATVKFDCRKGRREGLTAKTRAVAALLGPER